ncbi:hypothetical protein BD324DRAFT_612118 [Kockovaella imperatae]|uniref:Uncharacterized protein n=1 Tax=Kockovaella imperatae TaxID=4999 RepID=A0A1Y1US32_9TREE|nr:hypothetical protein BD324DRAFT_612118 [Kockovaella imperatae]ORX40789.1 hypothetical protein BD324DRAFT_612118 [Kockovaella imperatae]
MVITRGFKNGKPWMSVTFPSASLTGILKDGTSDQSPSFEPLPLRQSLVSLPSDMSSVDGSRSVQLADILNPNVDIETPNTLQCSMSSDGRPMQRTFRELNNGSSKWNSNYAIGSQIVRALGPEFTTSPLSKIEAVGFRNPIKEKELLDNSTSRSVPLCATFIYEDPEVESIITTNLSDADIPDDTHQLPTYEEATDGNQEDPSVNTHPQVETESQMQAEPGCGFTLRRAFRKFSCV